MTRVGGALRLWAAAWLLAAGALAQAPPPGAPNATSPAPAGTAPQPPPDPQAFGTCTERVPEGKARPKLTESFPKRGLSGHAQVLKVTVEHGRAETVMPAGVRSELAGDELAGLERRHFFLPSPDGDARPKSSVQEQGERATTTLEIPFVALPPEPGRQQLVLPPLPISLARASGEVITLCTRPHPITIEDPIANEPDPKPKPNPDPRRQLEEWTFAKHAALATLLGLLLAALIAALVRYLRKRPKKAPPPVPARPAWEVALEDLHSLRHAGLVQVGRYAEHFDRASDILRRYLGDRYGFDGLESTTHEIIARLRRLGSNVPDLESIERLLRRADLVKFARLTPSEAECETTLDQSERIVRQTMPGSLAPAASGNAPPADPPGAPPAGAEPAEAAPEAGGRP